MTLAQGVLDGTGTYLHWGVIQISLTNVIVILAMVAIFVLAVVLPFPGGPAPRAVRPDQNRQGESDVPH